MQVLNSEPVQRPNKAVERTDHTTGFFYMRVPVACGPSLGVTIPPTILYQATKVIR
jgi:hypothetical protein